jgi:hypothetical protein
MHAGALPLSKDDAPWALLLPPWALKVESCSVFRPLPHLGQLTFSDFDSTSFSYAVRHSSQMYS